jgi:uncharacterized protein with PhoU and TrkA domain
MVPIIKMHNIKNTDINIKIAELVIDKSKPKRLIGITLYTSNEAIGSVNITTQCNKVSILLYNKIHTISTAMTLASV